MRPIHPPDAETLATAVAKVQARDAAEARHTVSRLDRTATLGHALLAGLLENA